MENQEQNPPQQEQPFVVAKQVGFNLEDVILNINNEVALLYLEHNNKDHFKCVSNFISKCCYLLNLTGVIYGEVGVNTFRNAIGTHYLPHSSEYVTPPSIDTQSGNKGGSSKEPTGSKIGHFKKRKESSLSMDSNPSQPPVFTPMDTGMHKKDQQATGGPTSLGVASESRANTQLSSGMPTFNLNKPIYSASFIIHSEFASGNDASAASTTEVDPGNSAPSDFVPQQHGMNEGTKNTSYDHLFAGTDPYVLADQTKSFSEGLETILTQPRTGKWASFIARQIKEEEASITIKLEYLAKLVPNVKVDFKDLYSPKDDPITVVDDSEKDKEEDKNEEIHSTTNDETKDISALHLYLQETKKTKAKAEITRLKAQSSISIMGWPNELLAKPLTVEFSKILSAHDFSSSLPTELKDLPSKFDELTKEIKWLKKQVHELDIELPRYLKEIPSKLEESLAKCPKALNKFAQVLDYVSSKAGDQSVPLAGQADNMLADCSFIY
ncbi:hypothetical protein Tco_1262393 [Tanacetum coccineum]